MWEFTKRRTGALASLGNTAETDSRVETETNTQNFSISSFRTSAGTQLSLGDLAPALNITESGSETNTSTGFSQQSTGRTTSEAYWL